MMNAVEHDEVCCQLNVHKHADLMVGNISSIIFFMMHSLSRTSIVMSSGCTPLDNP